MQLVYPPKVCILTTVFEFSCDGCNSQEKLELNNGCVKVLRVNKVHCGLGEKSEFILIHVH